MAARFHLVVFMVAMVAGLVFAGFSTYDFVQHLDRQVHDLHCSFVPGLSEAARADESDCQVTLMSPYSSIFRRQFWGGIPISLPAMSVFAFLMLRAVDALSRPTEQRRRSTGVLFAMSTVPLLASVVMGTIAFVELDAACKLCIGIYGSSLVGFLAAGLAHASARRVQQQPADGGGAGFVAAVVQLGAFVLLPVGLYVALMPDYSRFVGTCGRLADTVDPYGVLVPLDDHGGTEVIEVLDPLCPTCRGFEHRLQASGLEEKIHRKVLLFPLDECNWNLTAALHPGACTVSKAVLCAAEKGGPSPREVIDWAFASQPELLAAAKSDPELVRDRLLSRFSGLEDCIASAETEKKLNNSMWWAVKHSLPVLTPQIYVSGVKLCGEDTDLGLEYTLQRLLDRQGQGGNR